MNEPYFARLSASTGGSVLLLSLVLLAATGCNKPAQRNTANGPQEVLNSAKYKAELEASRRAVAATLGRLSANAKAETTNALASNDRAVYEGGLTALLYSARSDELRDLGITAAGAIGAEREPMWTVAWAPDDPRTDALIDGVLESNHIAYAVSVTGPGAAFFVGRSKFVIAQRFLLKLPTNEEIRVWTLKN